MGTGLGKVQRWVLSVVCSHGGMYVAELMDGASTAQRSSRYRAIAGLVERGHLGWTKYPTMGTSPGLVWIYDPSRSDMTRATDRER